MKFLMRYYKQFFYNQKERCLIVIATLLMSLLFLCISDKGFLLYNSQIQGIIAYNILHHGTIRVDTSFNTAALERFDKEKKIIPMHELFDTSCNVYFPKDPPPINDTIGYAVLLAFLWKITNCYSFFVVQVLQIILYIGSLLLLFECAILLYGSRKKALLSLMLLLAYFPLTAMIVQPIRDGWAFYGIVALLYGYIFFTSYKQYNTIFSGTFFFSLIQWIRPSVFLFLPLLSIVFLLLTICYSWKWRLTLSALLGCWIINVVIFWIPFCVVNQSLYNRPIVGPVGQDLIEGLGEFPNKWGYKLNDKWLEDYIGKKYSLTYGTQEFDDAAGREFYEALYQDPYFYIKTLIKRLPVIVLPGLPWIFLENSPYENLPIREKLKVVFSSRVHFLDFLLRQCYIRLYLLFGYIGLIMLLYRKEWVIASLLLAIIISGLGKFPSHIEYRYIVPYYWVFSLFIVEVVWYVRKIFSTKLDVTANADNRSLHKIV
jgi:hypothetical protein